MSVTKSMDTVAGRFEMEITQRPNSAGRSPLPQGGACTVSLGGQTVITGHLETVHVSYDSQSHGIRVGGRDVTGDLADCSHLPPPSQWRGCTLLRIATEMCRPFGIPVVAEYIDDDFEAPETFGNQVIRANEGDTVLSMLAKLAKQRGVLLVSYGDGKLALTRAGSRGANDALVLGGNVLSASGGYDAKDRYQAYIVKGNGLFSDFGTGQSAPKLPGPLDDLEARQAYVDNVMAPRGVAMDSGVRRYRPLVIVAESKGDKGLFQRRADWEATHRAGKSQSATYRVQGWQQSNGQVWPLNTTVQVRDAFMGLSQAMLIERLRFSLGPEGTFTEIGVTPPGTHAVFREPGQAGGLWAAMTGGGA